MTRFGAGSVVLLPEEIRMQAIRSAVLAAVLTASASGVLAQAEASQQQPATAQPTWLRAGASWQYLVTQSNQAKPKGSAPVLHTVVAESTAEMPDGSELHQLRVARGKNGVVTFEVWSADGGSILQHETKSLLRRGELQEHDAPMQIWRGVSSASADHWKWRGPLLGVDVGSGNVAGEAGRGQWHHEAESLGNESIEVPAGTFTAEHIRIRSEQGGHQPCLRDVWLVPEVGVVREERRCGQNLRVQRLKEFSPGSGPDTDRVIRHVEESLEQRSVAAFNNTPRVTWLQAGPEALLLAGRIATVHTDSWAQNYLVGRTKIVPFGVSGKAGLVPAAYAAFDSKTAVPTKHVSFPGLALLLARSEAALHQFGKVRAVPVTLTPTIRLQEDPRKASAQVTGGALDGTQRNIAVWLSFGKRWQYHMAADMPKPAVEAARSQNDGGR
tara:strand:+ start:5032 stop:6354 length:1323 start_codon:yes stop_codon:yes gene_type:complete